MATKKVMGLTPFTLLSMSIRERGREVLTEGAFDRAVDVIWFITHEAGISVSIWELEIFGGLNAKFGFKLLKIGLKGRAKDGPYFCGVTNDGTDEIYLYFKRGGGLHVVERLIQGQTKSEQVGTLIKVLRKTSRISAFFSESTGGLKAARLYAENLPISAERSQKVRNKSAILPILASMYPKLILKSQKALEQNNIHIL